MHAAAHAYMQTLARTQIAVLLHKANERVSENVLFVVGLIQLDWWIKCFSNVESAVMLYV